jgi:multimeric flavodoxin WrbA
MIRVLGIAGSPRRGGNTETLLDRSLAGAKSCGGDVRKIAVAELNIEGCVDCESCWEDGHCVSEDDYELLCQELIAADVIALASPLYFWNVPSQVKVVIDRSQCMWARKVVVREPLPASDSGYARRRGVFISVGGQSARYFEGAVRTVKSFFRVYNTDYWAEVLYPGVDAKGEVEQRPLVLKEAYDLGAQAVRQPWT